MIERSRGGVVERYWGTTVPPSTTDPRGVQREFDAERPPVVEISRRAAVVEFVGMMLAGMALMVAILLTGKSGA